MSQDVKILSKVLLNISLSKICTVNQSELTSQQYHAMELPTQVLRKKKQSMFFSLTRIVCNSNATGIFDAMIADFQKHDLSSLLQKNFFLSSDGAQINRWDQPSLIFLLLEDREWVTFIWCFSHRLELALKNGLKMYTSPVDESPMHLFYLYKNSSKKHTELKNLF